MNRSLSLALSMSRRLVTFSLFAMWLFVAGVVIWIGLSVLLGTKFGLPMLRISVSILMMATVLDRISTNTARRLNTYQQNEGLAFADAMYFFENAIIDQKRPLVRIESSIEKIAKAAAELVRDAVAALPIGEFQVVFFGAVGFQIAPDDWRRETGVDETLSPHQVYHGALEEIASKSIPVGRFVSLLTDKE